MNYSVAAPRGYRTEPDIEVGPLLDLIKLERGLDFTGYRRASLARRVEKRMRSVGLHGVAEYRELLRTCPLEREKLVDAILINVTRFFRDESSWAFLAERVVPQLLGHGGGTGKIRVWSAGCASGEEAYTLAMLFAEAMGMDAFTERVAIHATDVDDDALRRGRYAWYTERELRHLPDALRRKYFQPAGGHHAVRDDLRRRVRFRWHNLTVDAPITHVDLLACRNTLMYLNADTQRHILSRFHHALNDGGVLFLGRAETLLTHDHAFRPIDLKRRISAKVPRA
ncbi:MAG TPA: CheR family methyltransferase [Gemmatimonadaceae bacterium]|nr:CheR family methyltransferase [Gemmatimonadaceae bacterium]